MSIFCTFSQLDNGCPFQYQSGQYVKLDDYIAGQVLPLKDFGQFADFDKGTIVYPCEIHMVRRVLIT